MSDHVRSPAGHVEVTVGNLGIHASSQRREQNEFGSLTILSISGEAQYAHSNACNAAMVFLEFDVTLLDNGGVSRC